MAEVNSFSLTSHALASASSFCVGFAADLSKIDIGYRSPSNDLRRFFKIASERSSAIVVMQVRDSEEIVQRCRAFVSWSVADGPRVSFVEVRAESREISEETSESSRSRAPRSG